MVYVLRPGTAHRTSPSVFAPHPSLCAVLQHGGFVEHPQQGHLFFFCQLGIVDADLSHQDIHLLFQRGTFKLLRIFKLLPRLLDGCAVRRGLIGPMCRFDLLQDRRQLILTTKDKPADRTDDPFLVEKMCAELEGILLWCLEGLHRLVQNDFRFTVSERAAANVDTIKRSSNNVIDFMESEATSASRRTTPSAPRSSTTFISSGARTTPVTAYLPSVSAQSCARMTAAITLKPPTTSTCPAAAECVVSWASSRLSTPARKKCIFHGRSSYNLYGLYLYAPVRQIEVNLNVLSFVFYVSVHRTDRTGYLKSVQIFCTPQEGA